MLDSLFNKGLMHVTLWKYSEFKKTFEHEEWNFGSRKNWYRCNLRLKNKPVGMPVDKSLTS